MSLRLPHSFSPELLPLPEIPPPAYGPEEEVVFLTGATVPEPVVEADAGASGQTTAAVEAAGGETPPAAMPQTPPASVPEPVMETAASEPTAAEAEAPPGEPSPAAVPQMPPPSAPEPVAEAAAPSSEPAVAAADPPPATPEDHPLLVPEDAFPTLEELDAMLAAYSGPPPAADAATRAEVVAMLGLDPAIAADPDLYLAAIEALAPPEPDPVPGHDLSGTATFAWPSYEPQGGWLLG
ncbi:hypothetical protein GXW74_11560 [Roseomonas eburnea]|uniref:Uncharacterized protein n=1 Tax=Neoroseomonas eburnea TaxID=1346889 RepID=A0A9X9XBP0_9PROT|nr:hypothetical protein [Neoroseomonas eburnea]MBR0681126.1 hypothetical protein [Neoroseomonas eburnea]